MLPPRGRVMLPTMRNIKTYASLIAVATLLLTPIVHAGGEEEMLAVGSPFVEFELEAHDGTTVSSADLVGKPFLLFFYPKADTPG